MTDEAITPAVSDRICKHMNDDHADAVLLYARVYGDRPEATSAVMEAIDPQGMNLRVRTDSDTVPVRIGFDRDLKNADDAHHTLIDMLKQARAKGRS
ncbi:hypothetical protein CKA32_006642 [Geitlerinema sp. FC II]|uniref:DUF2470 domain-containing protein n=1 Tax=Baaleninema simplex TaxID=2862350 RepID=UPI00034890FB|nr:DUF2470 domain-containing protein [Baaleninema simplex]MDC0835534.1 DUF2470 domain-containing protein [Geitlerinema sp. CS-897]PPT08438.1 hypothetical protein CKA32_006642 [Geitlerinema sp. FC II]